MALQEFLIHGVAYVFPAQAGRIGRGIPAYVSASPLKEQLAANTDVYVWHHVRGSARGQQIKPLYPSVPEAVQRDEELYELLVIVDALRMGRAREKEIAINELNKRFEHYANNQ